MTAQQLTWSALEGRLPLARADRGIVALPEHRLLYVKNQKAGSSTLMVWLNRLHTGDFDDPLRHMHRDNGLPKVADLGADTVLAMLAGDAYRFSFVREPLRRLESVYRAKLFRDLRFRRRVIAKRLGLSPDPDVFVSFEEFLEAVERQAPAEMDRHWRPQHLNLLHPVITLDRVGRLESFDADLERIVEESGVPRIPVEPRNVAPSKPEQSVYDGRPDLRARVESLYATDMELYGY